MRQTRLPSPAQGGISAHCVLLSALTYAFSPAPFHHTTHHTGTAIRDEQIELLIKVLKKRQIWCLNIGETYNVSTAMWVKFCRSLPETMVTHLYVSEHVIDLKLKNKMRDNIRDNRKKHTKHCSPRNLSVIERCTNMWWNPINTIRSAREAEAQYVNYGLCLLFRGLFSIMLLPYSITTSALESSDLLLSCSAVTVTLRNTIILILPHLSTLNLTDTGRKKQRNRQGEKISPRKGSWNQAQISGAEISITQNSSVIKITNSKKKRI